MKFNRVLTTVGLTAATVAAVASGASAQEIPNYIGIGGSDEGLAINGKVAIQDNISIRPAIMTDFAFEDNDDVNYVVPVTYDFNNLGRSGLSPFVGTGVMGNIGDNSDVEFALTAGTDYRINDRLIANGSVNWAFPTDGWKNTM